MLYAVEYNWYIYMLILTIILEDFIILILDRPET